MRQNDRLRKGLGLLLVGLVIAFGLACGGGDEENGGDGDGNGEDDNGGDDNGGDISMITPYVNESDMRHVEPFFQDSHRGLDFPPTDDLAPFQAVSSGVIDVVSLVQLESSSNWQVELEIKHNSTYTTLYAFEPMTSDQTDGETQLSNISVSVGQTVSQGDIVGYLYNKGEGAHVHFSLFKYGSDGGDPAICPEPYFTQEANDSILRLIHVEYPDLDMCN